MKYLLIFLMAVSGFGQDAFWGGRKAFKTQAPSGSGTVFFQDEFTEASDTSLTNHTPTTIGSGWTHLVGAGAGSRLMATATDVCSPNAQGNGGIEAAVTGTVTSANYDVEVQIVGVYTTSFTDDPIHIIGRCADVSNFYAVAIYQNANTSSWILYKKVGGSSSDLATIDLDVVANDVVVLQLRSNSQKVFVNGVEKLSATDTSLTAAGKAGLGIGSLRTGGDDIQPAWDMDNFKVTYY